MKTLIFLTADYANITNDNKLNIMGIFDRIWSRNFPAKHPSFHLIIRLGRELGEEIDKDWKFEIKVINEDATWEHSLAPPRKFKFPEEKTPGLLPHFNIIFGIKDMVFQEPGIYQFIVLVDDKHQGSVNLDLVELESPPSE